MFPSYEDFTDIFADILDLATTFDLSYVLAAVWVIALLHAVVSIVRAVVEDEDEDDFGEYDPIFGGEPEDYWDDEDWIEHTGSLPY